MSYKNSISVEENVYVTEQKTWVFFQIVFFQIMSKNCISGFFHKPWHYADANANNRIRVRWVVLGLSQDGVSTSLFENLSVNSFE